MSEDKASILPGQQPSLRVMPMMSDINGFGSVFGGWTMSQMDIAGGSAAINASGGKVTTAAANINFERPLQAGNIVSFFTEVIGWGRTSIKVRVEAFAEQGATTYVDDSKVGAGLYPYRAATAEFVFVAVDEEGRKRLLTPRA